MTRTEVFKALDTERDYQLRRWGYRQGDSTMKEATHSVGEFLVYMQDYLTEAFHEASRAPGDATAIEVMRKVVALGIACFEQNGVPVRQHEGVVINANDGMLA